MPLRCAPTCCYNFLYGFKGAPPARQRRAGGPDASKGREAIERGCVTRDGHHQDQSGGAVGQLADSGAAAMSRPFGR